MIEKSGGLNSVSPAKSETHTHNCTLSLVTAQPTTEVPTVTKSKIIAISGSRTLQTAYRVGKMLAEHGYTIATGLAEGCDAAAAESALSAGGSVIGVVPCGLKALRSQPRKRLAQEIFAAAGAVISEYADNLSKVFPRHYLRRNEIITGLSEKTIIIAADERLGSSATANRAMKQGREVIITPHVKAKVEGATIVRNLGELKDELSITRERLKK